MTGFATVIAPIALVIYFLIFARVGGFTKTVVAFLFLAAIGLQIGAGRIFEPGTFLSRPQAWTAIRMFASIVCFFWTQISQPSS